MSTRERVAQYEKPLAGAGQGRVPRYCTVLYGTVLYCAVLCCSVLCTVLARSGARARSGGQQGAGGGEAGARLRERLVKMIENGQVLSERQARTAFAAYLAILLKKVSEFDEQAADKNRIELTLRFLQKVCCKT